LGGRFLKTRKENDVLGEVSVPEKAYWGISTQRALQNFRISDRRFPRSFLVALAEVKKACVEANLELSMIDNRIGRAIAQAVDELLQKRKFLEQFPIDVFSTGSGTQINMNMNEVLANMANEILGHPLGKKFPVHPNDHVNKCQSSNDVIPVAMHLSALELINSKLFPALHHLNTTLEKKKREFKNVIKVSRTHLQDAVPIHLSAEFAVYQRQVETSERRLKNACNELYFIPIGGTVVGTGLGADKKFGKLAAMRLRIVTGFPFRTNPVRAEGIASHNAIANLSSTLRLLALSILKMTNDIRWMGSGPHAGLGELIIPSNEPGSSIMPGKINPTQAEALIQVCLQVMGNDTTISLGEAFGSTLDLNTTKPLMIFNLLESIEILANGVDSFVKNCLKGLRVNKKQIDSQLERNLMVITNLVSQLGYDKASEIAQIATKSNKTLKQVVTETKTKFEGNLDKLLDPRKMA
jgi:fumarate hydratase class II